MNFNTKKRLGTTVKKLFAIVTTSLLLLFMAPTPTASAGIDSSVCHFASMSYYGWPGGGSIDNGISVGMTRQMKTFEPNKTDDACLSFENTMTGTVRESVASMGEFTWQLHGKTIPEATACSVSVSVNGQPWFIANAEPLGVVWLVRKTFDPELEDGLKPLLKLGANELSAQSDCGEFSDGPQSLTANLNVLQDSFGEFGGVSINDGDDFTNSASVNLNLSFDGIVAQVAVSNDGGFPKSQTQVFDYKDNTVIWKLRASTSKLPRKVYIRYRLFADANDGTLGIWEKQVYSDDIILDDISPVITATRVSSTASRATTVLDNVSKARTKVKAITITAKDDLSGLARLDISAQLGTGAIVKAAYGSTIKLALTNSRNTVYVRAVDAVGNTSAWKALSTK
jgi:hypothetical protein